MFGTRYNYFEYTIMSFKFVNASVIFLTLIDKTLRELMNHMCIIYLNNIPITLKHARNIESVCARCSNIYINLNRTQNYQNIFL